ncbi:PQQ-binding-like beta-propeller repeat protein [Streptomyces sp. NPDC087440]|uniref:outer membrane protein assembly factor BamB family protein n=1 Tax=Streptomyces sp. NPDC087440 TaxID=3365790 RepID=UPI00381872E2
MTQPPNQPPQNGEGAPPPSPFSKSPEPGQNPGQNPGPQNPGHPNPAPQDAPPQSPPPTVAGGFGAPTPPPAGGFGAPTPPPAGGFGAPTPPPPGQQPPQQPAYGYPQAAPATPPPPAPGQPPQGPPVGYGYPGQPGQAQPNPYGGQQQPGYGYPGQPGQQPGQVAPYGMQPPQGPAPQTVVQGSGGGGGGGLTNQMKIIIAAVLAVVLIVGVGVVIKATSGDDPKDVAGNSTGGGDPKGGDAPKAPDGAGKEKAPPVATAKVGFQVPLPVVKEITTVRGSWATDTVYAKSAVNSVVGYDPVSGTEKWKIPLDGSPCGGSLQVTADNKAAIVFQGKKQAGEKIASCTEVGLIDLNAGKLLWQKNFPDGDRKKRLTMVTISGTTVAAAGYSGGGGFNLADGKELWSPKPTADQCSDIGYAGGENLIAVRQCGDYDNPQILIQNLKQADGAPLSTYKMPDKSKYVSVVSTKPLVVGANVGESGEYKTKMSHLFSVDEKTGKQRAQISVDSSKFTIECDSDDVGSCSKIAVGNGRVYLSTVEHKGQAETGRTNEIVSFDLATGKPTSDNFASGERYTMVPLRMDGGNLIVYKFPPYDKGGQVASLDGGSGKQTVLLDNPADRSVRDAEQTMTLKLGEVRFHQGRLYMGTQLISESPSTYKKYLALAFVPAK